MDAPLDSSRYNGGGGGGGGGYHHHDRRGGRGGGGPHRRRGRGGGGRFGGGGGGGGHHARRHHPYRRGGGGDYHGGGHRGGGGGRPKPGNRFGAQQTTSVDPQSAVLRQLRAMVAKMGDLSEAAKAAAEQKQQKGQEQEDLDAVEAEQKENSCTGYRSFPEMRSVVTTVSKNIGDLVAVLCNPENSQVFLTFKAPPPEAADDQEQGLSVRSDVNIHHSSGDDEDAAAAAKIEDHDAHDQHHDADASASNANSGDNAVDEGNGHASQKVIQLKAEEEAGALATIVVSCAFCLPLQIPSAAGLTLGVHVSVPKSDFDGFAARCVTMATRRLGHDLDSLFLPPLPPAVDNHDNDSRSGMDPITNLKSCVDAFLRVKLLLRYMALLARVHVIKPMDDATDLDVAASAQHQVMALHRGVTMAGLLRILVQAAEAAMSANNRGRKHRVAAAILVSWVLHTLPYCLEFLSHDHLQSLLQRIETNIFAHYQSPYQPGVGSLALLLRAAPKEEKVGGDGDDDEEEEDDEDDEDDDYSDDDDEKKEEFSSSPGQVCDTLQDLFRTTKTLLSRHADNVRSDTKNVPTRFALLFDAPWHGLRAPVGGYAPMEGDAEDEMERRKEQRMTFRGEPILLKMLRHNACRSLPLLLRLGNDQEDVNDADKKDARARFSLQCRGLQGIVYGRLPIFDPPPDEGEEEEEGGASASSTSPQMDAYVKTFDITDRCLIADAIRDCLLCHRPCLSDAGVERGGNREVAEQLWAVTHLIVPPSDEASNPDTETPPSRGIEYGIVETILSLILQSSRSSDESASPLDHVYLSRVLMELTKLQPTLIPPAIAAAVSNLFQDFIPSLAPRVRQNLSEWFAFHLTNTDYQWPKSFWDHWTPHVTVGTARIEGGRRKRNSRGEFVSSSLRIALHHTSSPAVIVDDCLPAQSPLVDFLMDEMPESPIPSNMAGSIASVEHDVQVRIWETKEDIDAVRDYVVGDEASESVRGSMDDDLHGELVAAEDEKMWWRTGLVMRALLHPLARERTRMDVILKRNKNSNDNDMVLDDEVGSEDVLTDTTDAIGRYRPVLLAAMAKDVQVHDENLDLRGEARMDEAQLWLRGQVYLLSHVEAITSFSPTLLETVLESLLRHCIVSPMGVVQMVLGKPVVESHWWTTANLALRVGMAQTLETKREGGGGGTGKDKNEDKDNNKNDNDDEVGMIIDDRGGTDESEGSVTLRLWDFCRPLVEFVLQRVCHLLQKDGASKRFLWPLEVDLVEGTKHLVRNLYSTLLLHRLGSRGNEDDNDDEWLDKLRWQEMMAQDTLCDSKAVRLLAKALERI